MGRTRQVAPLRSTRNWRLWHVAWIGSLWVRKGTRTHQAGTDGLLIEHLFVRGRGDERRRLRLRLQPRERARHLRHLNLHKARTVVTVVTVVVRRQRAQPCTGSGSTVAATPSSARCLLLRRGGSTRHSGGRAGRWRGHRSETTAWSTASSHDGFLICGSRVSILPACRGHCAVLSRKDVEGVRLVGWCVVVASLREKFERQGLRTEAV